MKAQSTLGWLPGLDGIRGLAVAAVILYHYNTKAYLPGGLFGVDVFFVLSGFLITVLLVGEWRAAGDVSLSRFYMRRALRLLPALAGFVAVYTAVAVVLRDHSFTGRPSIHESLENLAYVASGLYSWAVALERVTPGGFHHLWSLSVEAQYYLVWPVLLVVLLRLKVRTPTLLVLLASLMFAASCLPLLLDSGWVRVYFGADYRALPLVTGSFAGVLYAGGYLRDNLVGDARFRLAALGAGLYVAYIMTSAVEHRLYDWYVLWIPLLSFATAILVLWAACADCGLTRIALGNPIITYVGRRSYAIYLWHFPAGRFLHDLGMLEQLLLAAAVTLVAAELSYRVLEKPALRLKDGIGQAKTPAAGLTELQAAT